MPELPEVETIKRKLESSILNLKIESFSLYNKKALDTKYSTFANEIKTESIVSFDRRGKFLIINLSNYKTLIFHLRMEGKLYVFDSEKYIKNKHDVLTLYLSQKKILVFNDVRKFGRIYFYESNVKPICLKELGQEANKLDEDYVLNILKEDKDSPIKETITNQKYIAGIGNIYADEILYACKINPFAKSSYYATIEYANKLAFFSNKIINSAIENSGSTVKSYKPSINSHGNFQEFLKVYSKENTSCSICKSKIMKRKNDTNRGTSYCYKCQNVGLIIGITGLIAVGKTTAATYIQNNHNFKFINCDNLAKKLYENKIIRDKLRVINPDCFNKDNTINKSIIKENLLNNNSFRKRWLSTLYPLMKKEIIKILNKNPFSNYIIEAATLFKAKLESICNYVLYIESNKSIQHLIERNDKNPSETIKFNTINNVDKYKKQCIILNSSGTKKELEKQIDKIFKELNIK